MSDAETALDPLVVEFNHPGVGRIEIHGEFADEYVFDLIRRDSRFYESDLLAILERIGLSEGLAVDAGAHIGNHTVYFAKVLGLRTLAIEPRPESVALLRDNVAANGVEEMVTVVQAVLGAEKGRASLEQVDEKNTGQVVARPDAHGTLEMRRLEEIVDARVALLKVDVEGAEAAVLAGAKDLIRRHRPLISVEAHTGRALDAVDDVLRPFDYRPIAVAGRSDNYLFASASRRAPVPIASAESRASLVAGRWRDQVLLGALDRLSDQVRSVGQQLGRFDVLERRLDELEEIGRRLAGSGPQDGHDRTEGNQ